MKLRNIDTERRLYVIEAGPGYSCLGFDVAFNQAKRVAEWLGEPLPSENIVGLAEGFWEYRMILESARLYCQEHNTRCPTELTPSLVGLEGRRVEVMDFEGNTRRFQVGRSTGWLPIHLELHNRRSTGGMAAGSIRAVRRVIR